MSQFLLLPEHSESTHLKNRIGISGNEKATRSAKDGRPDSLGRLSEAHPEPRNIVACKTPFPPRKNGLTPLGGPQPRDLPAAE